jgi:hypothetical protein
VSDAWDTCPELRRVDTEGRRFGDAITEAAVSSLQSARFRKLGPLQRDIRERDLRSFSVFGHECRSRSEAFVVNT